MPHTYIKRVLVGQFFHETHGFNPHPTPAERVMVRRGDALLSSARGTGTTLGGIVDRFTAIGYEIVPTVGFVASPSGPIEHAFFASLSDELLSAAQRERIDAVALDLHGAMCTTESTDVEGEFLQRLRVAVGPHLPIGIGLDMHAHVTRAMLRNADICIACKQCPHVDFHECGERVAQELHEMLEGRLHPVRAMAKAPMIHLDSGLTASAPFCEVRARADELIARSPSIRDISLYQVFRFADYDEQKGHTAVVLSDGAPEVAKRIAQELAGLFWNERERFRSQLPTVSMALDRVARERALRPFVLGDTGDRVLAGAPGDSTAILHEALQRADDLRGAIPITDPVSVAAATAARVGAEVELQVGGRLTPGFKPLAIRGTVVQLGDGSFTVSGPVLDGERASLGRTAVVLVDGRLTLLLMSEPGFTHTPAAFTSQGIDLASQDFIVAKSSSHFHANFAGVATPFEVATPGLSHFTQGFFPWRNARFWPEHEIERPDLRARVFIGRSEQPLTAGEFP
jgi:microcystin degradation protein MlrC